MKPVVVTLTGPSCSGKSFLEQALLQHGFGRAISHTTREPRHGEVHDRDYHFIGHAEFEAMIEKGQFVEQVQFGEQFYGMSADAMNLALEATGRMVVVVDPEGAGQVRHYCDENGYSVLSVWVACDVEEQVRRFVARTKGMNDETAVKRLTLMMTTEQEWRRSASVGRVNGYPYRFHMELWKAGPEMEGIYVEGIKDACDRLQAKKATNW